MKIDLAWPEVVQMATIAPAYCAIRGRFVPSKRSRPNFWLPPTNWKCMVALKPLIKRADNKLS
jgi:hypothetical protein